MKALLINSSYRKNGNTAAAISTFESEFIKNKVEVETVNIAHQNILTCREKNLGTH